MPGMKRDCGGAAGILGAFYAAVSQGKLNHGLKTTSVSSAQKIIFRG